MTLDELIGLTLQDGGKVITVTGLKIISFDDGGKMIFEANGTGEESMLLEMYRNNSINWLEDVYNVNDILGETTFVFVKFSGDNLRIELMQHEITDQQAVDAAAANVPATLELTEDFQIPESELGTTITITSISSELTPYIDDTTTAGWLLVTQPDSDVTGTITVEISKGTATPVSVNIAVTVKAPAAATEMDLIISEVLDWDGGTNKVLELYNPTSEAITLDGVYTIKINVNDHDYWGSAIELTGTIQPGETFVIANASEQALLDLADQTSGSLSFNGDDAIGLFKNDTLLDMFGVFGEDPGTGWAVGDGTTANSSISRISSVTSPTATWDVNEWVYADDADNTIGTHTVD